MLNYIKVKYSYIIFYIRHETTIGAIYGIVLNKIGMLLLRWARKLIASGGGNFKGKRYDNCSWCGKEFKNIAQYSHYGKNGLRCGEANDPCYLMD